MNQQKPTFSEVAGSIYDKANPFLTRDDHKEAIEVAAKATADVVYAECEEIARRRITMIGHPLETEESKGYVLACTGIANEIVTRRDANGRT